MDNRRNFLKGAPAAVLPVAVTIGGGGVALADDGSVKEFLGAWQTTHSLPSPFPSGAHFSEFLSFVDGGVVHETNSFLNTASNLDFSGFGLPRALNASDGFGNWVRIGKGRIRVVFRKMLFDGEHRNTGAGPKSFEQYADLRSTGELTSDGTKLSGNWIVEVVEPFSNKVLVFLGSSTTEGIRIG